jgi:hypothetical protein
MNHRRRLTALLALGLGGIWLSQDSSPTGQSGPAAPDDADSVAVGVRTGGSSPAPAHVVAPAPRSGAVVGGEVLLEDLAGLSPTASWAPRQLLVTADSADRLVELAEEHDLQVALSRSVDGMGVLRTAPDVDLTALRRELQAAPGVISARRHGVIRGAASDQTGGTVDLYEVADGTVGTADPVYASDVVDVDDWGLTELEPESTAVVEEPEAVDDGKRDSDLTTVVDTWADQVTGRANAHTQSLRSLQWHLDLAEVPASSVPGTVVAVLDTGLAYRHASVASPQLGPVMTTVAPSLAGLPLRDPWDFLEDAPSPDDEHWHGTHITSIIASQGAVEGAAPGTTVVPYRVLDANNTGLELHLIDALEWAPEVGADVVNMSLSFGPGYQPSKALLQALKDADAAGVVLVGAAGNNGDIGSTWPAASPHVISVGATCAATDLEPAPYSNHGGDVELYAPGGCLDRDDDANGYPDGILAETIAPNTPDQLGYFWAQGTSQAAAVVSGMAARLLDSGVPAGSVRDVLQLGGDPFVSHAEIAVAANMAGATLETSPLPPKLPDYRVGMFPWIQWDAGSLTPQLVLVVVDEAGHTVSGVTAHGTFVGSTKAAFSCQTYLGLCLVSGEGISGTDAVGWTVTVDRISVGAQSMTPTGVLLASESLELAAGDITSAIGDVPPLGVELPGGILPNSVHAHSFPLMGSGLTTSPFGVVITEPFLDDLGAALDPTFGGSGLSTSPFGVIGIGLPGLPVGPDDPSLITVGGSGLSTSPFGVVITNPRDPLGCLGFDDCPTSVVDPIADTVVGTLDKDAASLDVLGGDTEKLAIRGSAAMFEDLQAVVPLDGQGDKLVELILK